jgi:flavin reductase (DIM6/NTAB) family NADH-FMN oxidoreductase RutF
MATDIAALFGRLTLGVYLVGVADGARRDVFTASAVMQASYRPLLLSVAINPTHASYPLLQAGRSFAVSVLAAGHMGLAGRFGTEAQPAEEKMKGAAWRAGRRGAPILAAAIAFFDCELDGEMPAGDHRIVLGRVVDGAVLQPTSVALAYADTGNLDHSAALYPKSFEAPPWQIDSVLERQ